MKLRWPIIAIWVAVLLQGCLGQGNRKKEAAEQQRPYLVLVEDTTTEGSPVYCYLNQSGDTIVPAGKYPICYTDTIFSYGIVITADGRCIAIDRQDRPLYQVYIFDNGPDYISEGLFRIVDEQGNVGFASADDGNVVIPPRFAYAEPFSGGLSLVTDEGFKVPFGEYWYWDSDDWYHVDTEGNRL